MTSILRSADFSRADIERFFIRADHFRKHRSSLLKNKVVGLLFFENSSRTRVSFEMAALRLGAQVVQITAEGSSIQKGETELDTAQVMAMNGVDVLVVRTGQDNGPKAIADAIKLPTLNAGEGVTDHPSQGLLDAYTLTRHFGSLEGKTIAIVGDVKHSRVAMANLAILPKLGAKLRFVGPEFFLPEDTNNVQCFTSLEEGLRGADAVMALRIQKERLINRSMAMHEIDYIKQYGMTKEARALANPDAVVMHPMPMNRGLEIADDVADDPTRSLIYKQMENGLYIRMAMFEAAIK